MKSKILGVSPAFVIALGTIFAQSAPEDKKYLLLPFGQDLIRAMAKGGMGVVCDQYLYMTSKKPEPGKFTMVLFRFGNNKEQRSMLIDWDRFTVTVDPQRTIPVVAFAKEWKFGDENPRPTIEASEERLKELQPCLPPAKPFPSP